MSRFVPVVLAGLLLVRAASGQPVDNNQAWEMVNKAIVEHIMGADRTLLQRYAIQLPSADLPVTWEAEDGGLYDLLLVADEVPDWGPTWLQKNTKFSEAYGEFVNALEIPRRPGVTESQLKKANQKWSDASDAVKAMRNRLAEEWGREYRQQQSLPPGLPRQTYGQWYREYAAPKIQPLLDTKTRAFGELFALSDPSSQYLRLVDNYVSAPPVSVAPPGAPNEAVNRYPFSISRNVLAAIKSAGEANYAAQRLAVSWSFDRDSGRRQEERESWGGGASYGPFFRASAGGNRYTLDIHQNTISLSYSAYNLSYLPISPGSWYSGLLVTRFKNGPFKENATVTPEKLWGPKGSLNLMPVGVVLAYKPRLSAKLTNEVFNRLQESHSAGGSISIGPFSIGGSHSRSLERVTWDRTRGEVTVENESPLPLVVAVICARLNYSGQ